MRESRNQPDKVKSYLSNGNSYKRIYKFARDAKAKNKTANDILNEYPSIRKEIPINTINSARKLYNPKNPYEYHPNKYDNTNDSKVKFAQQAFDDYYYIFTSKAHMKPELAKLKAKQFAVQDAMESGYGTSNLAKNNNNYGGMLSRGGGVKYDTAEDYYNRKYNDIITKYKATLSPDVITDEDFFRALNANPVYQYTTDGDAYLNSYKRMTLAKKAIDERISQYK